MADGGIPAEPRAAERSRAARPPRVPGLPLLGNVVELNRDALAALVRWYHTLGPAFRVKVPGRRATFLAGPRANAFLAHGGERYLDSTSIYRGLARDLGTAYYPVATEGRRHQHLRRTFKPAFSREAIAHYVPRMVEVAERMARSWQPGTRVRLPQALRFIVAEQLGLAMANHAIGTMIGDAITFARTSAGAGLGAYPEIARWMPHYRLARRRMLAFMRDVVAGHRAEAPGDARDPDLVDLLVAATDEDGRPLGLDDIVGNAQMIFSNSLLYSAPTCANLLYALLREPALMDRVTEEVDAVLGDGVPSLATLMQLHLLQAALRESMRMYPVALSVVRRAAQTFEFEGYRVEAGETIIVATSVCHFLTEFYPDPWVFDPSRCLAPRNEHRRPGAFVPFGLGAHSCLAAGLVEVMVMATVATILHTTRLVLDPPGYRLRQVNTPFIEPENRFGAIVTEQRRHAPALRGARRPVEDQLVDALPTLDSDQRSRLSARIRRFVWSVGDEIVRQGDRTDRFYVIAEGEVEVLRTEPGRASHLVARLGRGDYFGEIGLLHGVRRTATVRAVTRVVTLALERDAFVELVAESDLTAHEIGRILRRRVLTNRLAAALPRLDPFQLAGLLPRVELVRYAPGEVIIRQGEPADRFYVVSRGRVEVVNDQPRGDHIHLAWLEAGDYFGEIGLLQGRPRMATVRAGDDEVEMLALDRDAFAGLLKESPEEAQDIAAVMSARLASLQGSA